MSDRSQTRGHATLRRGRFSSTDQAYFVTKRVVRDAGSALVLPDCAEILIRSFLWARDAGWFRILGLIVMPDHYHLALGLGQVKSLSEAIAGVDKFTAAKMNAVLGRNGAFWSEGFYEHAIRDRRDFDGILAYMHNNPVKAQLCERAEDRQWSSAHPRFASEIDWDWLGVSLLEVVPGSRRFVPDSVPMAYR